MYCKYRPTFLSSQAGAQIYLMRAWERWSHTAATAYFPSDPLLLFAFALQHNNNVGPMLG